MKCQIINHTKFLQKIIVVLKYLSLSVFSFKSFFYIFDDYVNRKEYKMPKYLVSGRMKVNGIFSWSCKIIQKMKYMKYKNFFIKTSSKLFSWVKKSYTNKWQKSTFSVGCFPLPCSVQVFFIENSNHYCQSRIESS